MKSVLVERFGTVGNAKQELGQWLFFPSLSFINYCSDWTVQVDI
jgi:hypothetical protein